MLFDNLYYLSILFSHFLLDNPDILESASTPVATRSDSVDHGASATVSQRLETWLDRQTTITDPTHRATLLQLAALYASNTDERHAYIAPTGL